MISSRRLHVSYSWPWTTTTKRSSRASVTTRGWPTSVWVKGNFSHGRQEEEGQESVAKDWASSQVIRSNFLGTVTSKNREDRTPEYTGVVPIFLGCAHPPGSSVIVGASLLSVSSGSGQHFAWTTMLLAALRTQNISCTVYTSRAALCEAAIVFRSLNRWETSDGAGA
jgi:hypothetical protein